MCGEDGKLNKEDRVSDCIDGHSAAESALLVFSTLDSCSWSAVISTTTQPYILSLFFFSLLPLLPLFWCYLLLATSSGAEPWLTALNNNCKNTRTVRNPHYIPCGLMPQAVFLRTLSGVNNGVDYEL